MEQSANVSRLAHARMVGLLSILWIADVVMVLFAAECILVEGPTVMIMFASEVSLFSLRSGTLANRLAPTVHDLSS
jgi:E3 ubiquitin-protein ligase synoviolin